MNDFDWDVLQKKRIASNARRMKGGNKSKKCSLPDDLKKQYLANLQTSFNAPLPKISTDMFRMGHTSLNMYCRRHKIHSINMRGKTMNFEDNKRWLDWLAGVVRVEEEPAEDIIVDETIREEEPAVVEQIPMVEETVEAEPVETPAEEVPVPEVEASPYLIPEDTMSGWDLTDKPDLISEAPVFEMSDMAATFKGEYSTEKFLLWMSRLPLVEGRSVKIFMEIEAL